MTEHQSRSRQQEITSVSRQAEIDRYSYRLFGVHVLEPSWMNFKKLSLKHDKLWEYLDEQRKRGLFDMVRALDDTRKGLRELLSRDDIEDRAFIRAQVLYLDFTYGLISLTIMIR